jgi:hypothetical protein
MALNTLKKETNSKLAPKKEKEETSRITSKAGEKR